MSTSGFTLLEITMAAAILVIIGVLGLFAFQSATSALEVAMAKDDAQTSVREVLVAMTRELQLAAKTGNASFIPILEEVEVLTNPVPGSPIEIAFQTPLDGAGRNWSTRIRFRYINEDLNGNGRLDSGEDTDGDGALSRRILRIQDRNNDGDTTDPGEVMVVGGANDITNCQFARNGSVVTISLAAGKRIGKQRTHPATASVISRVYLSN